MRDFTKTMTRTGLFAVLCLLVPITGWCEDAGPAAPEPTAEASPSGPDASVPVKKADAGTTSAKPAADAAVPGDGKTDGAKTEVKTPVKPKPKKIRKRSRRSRKAKGKRRARKRKGKKKGKG